MNFIWPVFIIISYIYAIFFGNLEEINNSIFDSCKSAVELSITFLGTMCLWNGIMQIAKTTTLIQKLTHLLKPIMKFLFPEIKSDSKVHEEISMNMVANILGLGNAATPLGLKAILSNDMAMFIIINTASIQLIPTTVISIRSALGSSNPTSIILPVWIATICAAVAGIFAAKILKKKF